MKDAASTNHFGNRRSFIGGSDARIIMGTDRPAQFSAFTSGATPQTLDVNSPLPATMDQHPDIIAQKRLIKLLKSQPDNSSSGEAISNPAYVMLMSKLADTETEVAVDQNRLGGSGSRRNRPNAARG
jgi:hypothetical protein